MRRIILIVALVMVFSLAGINCSAFASDAELNRESLRGFNGVHVVLENLYPDLEKAGLSKSRIRTDVELKLRLAGIKVLTEEECYKEKGAPRIYISVNNFEPSGGLIVHHISCKFYQDVILERNPSLKTIGTTWSSGSLGFGNIKEIRANIKDIVDQFINAYLSVNPKK